MCASTTCTVSCLVKCSTSPSCSSTTGVTPLLCVCPAGSSMTAKFRRVLACVCACVLIRTYYAYVGTCVYVHVFVFACVRTHMLTNAMQTAAEVVSHPEWDKMVYFVCSSLQLKEPGAGSKGTQEELLHETCAPNEAERTCKPTSPVGQFFLTVGIHTLQP